MAQRWVAEQIQYVSDATLTTGWTECWLFPVETVSRRKGDCEDGAILIASLCRCLGIPADRIRVAAGTVRAGENAETGGHAWATYRRQSDDEWTILDWCFYEDSQTPVAAKPLQKENRPYFFGDEVWFSFNDQYAWSHRRDLNIFK